jgi:hypothetical protein
MTNFSTRKGHAPQFTVSAVVAVLQAPSECRTSFDQTADGGCLHIV